MSAPTLDASAVDQLDIAAQRSGVDFNVRIVREGGPTSIRFHSREQFGEWCDFGLIHMDPNPHHTTVDFDAREVRVPVTFGHPYAWNAVASYPTQAACTCRAELVHMSGCPADDIEVLIVDLPRPAPGAPVVERVFTFGYGHVDPQTGDALAETYALVRAATGERCREVMNGQYNRRWAFEYPSVFEASVGDWSPALHVTITDATPHPIVEYAGGDDVIDPAEPVLVGPEQRIAHVGDVLTVDPELDLPRRIPGATTDVHYTTADLRGATSCGATGRMPLVTCDRDAVTCPDCAAQARRDDETFAQIVAVSGE